MKARTRRILFLIFVLIFLILTSFILLYSYGYRLDWQRKVLTKTGNLYLVSHPPGAFVFLNEKPLKISGLEKILFYKKFLGLSKLRSTTPTLINYLWPEEYLLTLKKENYFPWEKKIKILPEKTIIFREILLFYQKPEIKFLKETPLSLGVSPDLKKNGFLSDSKKEISVIDLESQKETKFKTKENIKDLSWSPAGEKLVVYYDNLSFSILDLLNNSFTNLKDFLKQNVQIKNPKFFSDKELFFHSKESVYKFDLMSKKIEDIYSLDKEQKYSSLIDFIVLENSLFYLKKEGDYFMLEGFDLETKKNFYQLRISVNENYRFIDQKISLKDFIFLKDNENFFILDLKETDPDKAIILKTKLRNFDLFGTKLLYHDGFEVSLFDLKTKKKETIERTSKEISKVLWHPKGNYLFILFPKKIKILELDLKEKPNYVEYNFEKISDLILTKNYNLIYLIGEIENQEGIFKIKIQ